MDKKELYRANRGQQCAHLPARAAGQTYLRSSGLDLLVFSMNRVSLGAMPSKTTLRILDLPPLCVQ